MVNHQIPLKEDEETTQTPSNSYEERFENKW